jgi:RNA polymerase sigma factor (sigma-70 family)
MASYKHIDDSMVLRAQTGDRAAIEEVWRNSIAIRRFTSIHMRSEDRADWENESFFAVLHAIKNFNPELGRFGGYLAIYLRSYRQRFQQTARYMSRAKMQVTHCSLWDLSPTANAKFLSSPSFADEGTEKDELLHKALEKLTEQERDLITRYFGLNGRKPRTFQEMASSIKRRDGKKGGLGVTRQRVEQLLKKSLQRLRRVLEVNKEASHGFHGRCVR